MASGIMGSQADPRSNPPIVCGTDFSPTALEAIEIAGGLARRMNSRLILVHVGASRDLGVVDPSVLNAALGQEEIQLAQETERLRHQGTEVEARFRSGSAFDELVTTAIDANASLIVVGAVGHGLARRLLIGSVAERTAETSPVPTLVVRPGGKLKAWLAGKEASRMLVAYDFSPASDAALKWVNGLRTLGRCEIHVVHLYRRAETVTPIGSIPPVPANPPSDAIQNSLQRELEQRVAAILPSDAAGISIEGAWGSFESCLFEISHARKADLIVVGTHQRAGLSRIRFGSVSRSVLHNARISVAVVPPPEDHTSGHA